MSETTVIENANTNDSNDKVSHIANVVGNEVSESVKKTQSGDKGIEIYQGLINRYNAIATKSNIESMILKDIKISGKLVGYRDTFKTTDSPTKGMIEKNLRIIKSMIPEKYHGALSY